MPVSITPPETNNVGVVTAPQVVTVTAISTEIVSENTSRQWCALTNEGNKDVFVSMGSPAEVDKGVVLFSRGGSIVFGGDFTSTQAINGIVLAGNSKVATLEAESL